MDQSINTLLPSFDKCVSTEFFLLKRFFSNMGMLLVFFNTRSTLIYPKMF